MFYDKFRTTSSTYSYINVINIMYGEQEEAYCVCLKERSLEKRTLK